MDIKTSLAAHGYAKAKSAALAPEAGSDQGPLGTAVKDFAQTLQEGEQTAQAAMLGDADPHALVQALAETQLAVETAVTLRNKVVEAYQEILRMPV